MLRSNRVRRSWPGLLVAILSGAMLTGCENSQTTGPVENIPKESPVQTTGKDSMQEYLKGRTKGHAPAARP